MKILVADSRPWSTASTPPRGHMHLMQLFLKHGKELCWVSFPVDLIRMLRKRYGINESYIEAWKKGMDRPSANVWAFTPFGWLPQANITFFRNTWVGRNLFRWTWPSTRQSLAEIGFEKPDILWVGDHRSLSLTECVKPRNIVHRMYDLISGFKISRHLDVLEEETCRRATVVFAVSQLLVNRARQWTDRVVYLPNGVHVERFDTAGSVEPDDLVDIPHPRALYVGSIAFYVDLRIFEEIARARPKSHVVVIGPIAECHKMEIQRLSQLPNIHYLGPKPFDQVPNYMRHCDIGLMPFTAEERDHAASPNKMYEYGAAALPVVGRALRECIAAGSDALFYETPEECVQRIDEALADRDALGAKMRAFAEQNTWDKRYETVTQSLVKYGDIDPE